MKRITAALFAACAMSTPVLAYDDGPRHYNWTGLFVGIHGGHASAGWSGKTDYDPTKDGCPLPCGLQTFDAPSGSLDMSGFMGGAQIGYNWHAAGIVLGIEADISGIGASGDKTFLVDSTNDVKWHIKSEVEGIGTLRGKIGLPMRNVLIYATGGVAWARTSSRIAVEQCCVPPDNITANGSADETLTGWVGGGGIEWALTRGISVKAEYLYADFGSADNNFKGAVWNGAPYSTDSFKADLDMHIARVGINARF